MLIAVPVYRYEHRRAVDTQTTYNSVQVGIIESLKTQKALGALDSRDSLRASAAVRPVVLASSGFAESASPFQSARIRLRSRQKRTYWTVVI